MLIGINKCTMAYVGDGNNDAKSLRTAQIGIALGNTVYYIFILLRQQMLLKNPLE